MERFLSVNGALLLLLLIGGMRPVQAGSLHSERLLVDVRSHANNSTSEPIRREGNLDFVAQEGGDRTDTGGSNEFDTQNNSENIITLGQSRATPFVVAIPGSREERLDRVQEIIPQAFLTDSRRGRYIQAGAFSTRSEAEALSCQLRYRGFDARVVYFRVRS